MIIEMFILNVLVCFLALSVHSLGTDFDQSLIKLALSPHGQLLFISLIHFSFCFFLTIISSNKWIWICTFLIVHGLIHLNDKIKCTSKCININSFVWNNGLTFISYNNYNFWYAFFFFLSPCAVPLCLLIFLYFRCLHFRSYWSSCVS